MLYIPYRLDNCTGPLKIDVSVSGWCCHLPVTLVAITEITNPIHYHLVKLSQLIWISDTRRFHLRVPDLQMSCCNLTRRRGYQDRSPRNGRQEACLISIEPSAWAFWQMNDMMRPGLRPALLYNDGSHWLGASLGSALWCMENHMSHSVACR